MQPVPSQLREGWPFMGQVCIHFGGYLEARVASVINLLEILLKYSVKCGVFLHIMQ